MNIETPQAALQKKINQKALIYTAWVDKKVVQWIRRVAKRRFVRTISKSKKVISQMIKEGCTRKQMRAELAKRFTRYSEYELDRVLTTEATRAVNLGTFTEEQKDDMVIGWRIQINYKGCEVCRKMEAKGFIPRKQFKPEYLSPFHPLCECTVEPVFEGEE